MSLDDQNSKKCYRVVRRFKHIEEKALSSVEQDKIRWRLREAKQKHYLKMYLGFSLPVLVLVIAATAAYVPETADVLVPLSLLLTQIGRYLFQSV
jgi:hypothetical protein